MLRNVMRLRYLRLLLNVCLLGAAVIQAQERFRLADPQALSATGSGWAVDPRTGGLKIVLPVGLVGKEMSIPISLRINGQFKSQAVDTYIYGLPDPYSEPVWQYANSSDVTRPAHATVHLGYIAPPALFDGPADSELFVLEDGTQFRTEDLLPFTSWNAVFSLPGDFKFPDVAPPQVKVTTLGRHALYSTTSAGLGTTWGGRVLAQLPTGYGVIQDSYRLLMDNDRARVLVQLPDTGLWVPILWVDRFGHSVGLKWTKETVNLPPGMTSKQTVEVLGVRGQGARLQWAEFTNQDLVQDLICVDLLGTGSPAVSIVVKGYPGVTTALPAGAVSGNPILDVVLRRVAGPIGRPTQVMIGYVADRLRPTWAGGQVIAPIVQPPPTNNVLLRSWSFEWDVNRAAIAAMTDALGVRTTFHYSGLSIPTTQTADYLYPGDAWRMFTFKDLSLWGVTRTDSYDARSSKTLSRTWTPGTAATGEPTVVLRESFGDPTAASRWTELVYAKSVDNAGRDYGNGALTESRIWEQGKGSPTAKTVYGLRGAGLDGSYSAASQVQVVREGEPTLTISTQYDAEGLTETARWTTVGASETKVHQTETTNEARRDKLIAGRPTQVTATRFAPSGAAISPAVVTKMEYDPSTGLPSKNYRVVGVGQQGSSYFFDGEGRINLQIPTSDIPFISSPPYTSFAYDPATGLLSSQSNVYPKDGTILTRSFSNFDGAGRPQTIQDERGLVTKQVYDLLGRVVGITPPAGEATTIKYPDEWTRVTTRGSAITTEHFDGFGRLISRDLPDGSGEEISYDEFGRQDARVVISSGTTKQRRNKAQTLYDALDRPTTINSPGGASQGLAYAVDPAYPLWSLVTRTLNTPVTTSSSMEYRDGLGQGVRQVSPKGDITESVFDGSGALTKVTLTPAGGGIAQIREFKYDEGGRMIQRIEPETGTTLFSNFTSLGQPTTITEAEGRVRTLAYDDLGRMVQMSSGGERLSYIFSGLNLTSASSVTNGVTVGQRFEYNGPAKQLSLEETTQPGLLNQIAYGYDLVTAQMNAITYPNGRVVGYTRDALGRITGISQNGSPVVSQISFDEWGNRKRLTFASGAYSDWAAKDFGLHLDKWTIGYTASNGAIATDGTRAFLYDTAERLISAGDWDHLEHDAQGRLTAANSSSLALSTTHTHDAYGNNTGHTVSGTGAANLPANTLNPFAFNPMPDNRLPGMQANGVTTSGWVINGRGEATQVGVGTGSTQSLGLAWDGLGRLRAVVYDGGTQSYLYAPSGMRVALMESASATGTRRYAYSNGGLLLSEYRDQAGSTALAAPKTAVASLTSTSTRTPTLAATKASSKPAGTLAYLLPPGDGGGGVREPAGAWIIQPAGATTVTVGQAVTFMGGTDFGTTLTWAFGDGTTASGASVGHVFSPVGTYTVTFRASRVGFLTSTATVVITVAPPPLPGITFTASANTIAVGGYLDLSWSVSNATTVNITDLGNVASTGTARVWPMSNRPYLLTATGSGGTSSATVQITVVTAPVIRVFVSEPTSIQVGQAAKLTWTVDNANSYSLDQGIGTVNGTWAMVWPGSSMTFTLTATNLQNGVSVVRTASTTVTVGAASPTVWKRDVIYLGSEAIAEIDVAGIHELHNNHLSSPTIITSGSSAQIEGRQAFGPYGERVKSEGYMPLIGYTGHIQQDATGLIYMRGRYYSPAWHRFVNSDQGVDPNSWNQMAYVGGSPFHATDPSGMETCVASIYVESAQVGDGPWEPGYWINFLYECGGGGGGDRLDPISGGVSGGSGGAGTSSPQTPKPSPCALGNTVGTRSIDYSQSTGQLTGDSFILSATRPDLIINFTSNLGTGYAGTGDGRNNPDMQNVPFVGPLPQGQYTIGNPFNYTGGTGPYSMRLTPNSANDMFGRNGFLIHGNNAINDASHGCIVCPLATRQLIYNTCNTLDVVP